MNKRIFSTFAVLLLSFLGTPDLFSAEAKTASPSAKSSDTNAPDPSIIHDLNDLISRINAKTHEDKRSESDYADNIKEFDALMIKHKNAKVDDRVQILVQKAALYMQVLRLPEKALPIFEQIKKDFPSAQINGNTDELIAGIKGMVEKKKIRDALAPGAPFPDFKETDLEGRPLSISKYKGKVVLIDFWATWCPPCIIKLPEIQKVYDKYHDKGLEVVGISLDEDKDALEKCVKQRKMAWPEFFDGKRWENKLAVKYGVDSTPTTYLIGRDGKIIKTLDLDDDLDAEVAKVLKK